MPFRYLLAALALAGAALLGTSAGDATQAPVEPVRLNVRWTAEQGDYTYRLRGRYTIASTTSDFATKLASNEPNAGASSHVDVPPGVYSVMLEPGYTLERFETDRGRALPAPSLEDGSLEVVPASLVSPSALVVANGNAPPIGLTVISMPDTAAEPDTSCQVDGS